MAIVTRVRAAREARRMMLLDRLGAARVDVLPLAGMALALLLFALVAAAL